MITGKDAVSLMVLKELQKGTHVKEAAEANNISIDQAKRLSRYKKILEQADQNLSPMSFLKIQSQGLKILFLAELFKMQDWSGLEEVLAAVDDNTTRDGLKDLIRGLQEKRERTVQFQEEAHNQLSRLEKQALQLRQQFEELQQLRTQIREALSQFHQYDENTTPFILEHVGIFHGQYCLKRRLDSLWHKELKKQEIVVFDDFDFVHIIPNIDSFIESYHKRLKNRGNVLWDEDREYRRWERNSRHAYSFPDPYYKRGNALVSENLTDKLKEVEASIEKNHSEQEKIHKEIQGMRNTSVKSFIEHVTARDTLSAADLKAHGELQQLCLRWLYDRGYVAVSELVLNNGKRVDVIGYNEAGQIVIVEVKASRADLLADDKWMTYLHYCDEFYFCMHAEVASWRFEDLNGKTEAGLLNPTKRGSSVEVVAPSTLKHSTSSREACGLVHT